VKSLQYQPVKRVAEILNWCLQKIQGVPYKVTLRWIFYRAVQEMGLAKTDYAAFKKWTSRARKNFWNGWAPDTLVDDTREIYLRGGGYLTPEEWFQSFKDYKCVLDKRLSQPQIVMVWFEAEAMRSQFDYYAGPYHVSLAPFKGDYSIEKKWKLAKLMEALVSRYLKPVKVLYFGDLDPKGLQIPESALKDIHAWCAVPFEFRRVGLTLEHVKRWKLPDNPERPGQYQWEALSDQAAKELIQEALNREVDLEALKRVEALESEATKKWRKMLEKLLNCMKSP
jgi:hypothetical protein